MQREVEVTFKSKVDDLELEFIYDGVLIEDEHKILQYTEEIDNQAVDTAVIFDDTIMINRSNGVEMFQEFVEGESTVMDYSVNGLTFNIIVNTKEIVNKDNYLKIIYSTELGEAVQNHEIEIYYA
jgi:uncharacterized beta-barrel protein YwiB (DUF1934 family)